MKLPWVSRKLYDEAVGSIFELVAKNQKLQEELKDKKSKTNAKKRPRKRR